MTRSAKDAYSFAFEELGGGEGLRDWALESPENRREFYKLHAKLIPIDVTSGGEPIKPSRVEIALVSPESPDA